MKLLKDKIWDQNETHVWRACQQVQGNAWPQAKKHIWLQVRRAGVNQVKEHMLCYEIS